MKFEKYVAEVRRKIRAGEPVDWIQWEATMKVYAELVLRGVDPARARRILEIYIVEN